MWISQPAGKVLAVLIVLGVLQACASTTKVEVEADQEFPRPLVEQLPVHMGIYIPQEFARFAFEEYELRQPKKGKAAKKKPAGKGKGKQAPKDEAQEATETEGTAEVDSATGSADVASSGQSDSAEAGEVATSSETKSETETETETEIESASVSASQNADPPRLKMRVDLGAAQSRLVRTVFPPVFQQASLLDGLDAASFPEGLELYLVPAIKDLQYTTPKSTRLQVYEIWLQYNFKIYDRNADLVLDWDVPSYGKTPGAFMKSAEAALHAATQMALRDCGAAFSTGLRHQPALQRWLQGREARRSKTELNIDAGSGATGSVVGTVSANNKENGE